MNIEVTKTDINKGKRGFFGSCPIALAIQRAGACSVNVQFSVVFGRFNDKAFASKLPAEAVAFINRFDNSKPVEPFRFTIDP